MSSYSWIIAGSVVVGIVVAILYWSQLGKRRKHHLEHARKVFHQRREWLEAKFFELASSSGKPRGLRWKDCDFGDGVTFARDRRTGSLTAFVAVTISFEAIPGGDMEHVEAVGNLRAATALFDFSAGRWSTQGRAIMNLEPAEAIQRFHRELELIED